MTFLVPNESDILYSNALSTPGWWVLEMLTKVPSAEI